MSGSETIGAPDLGVVLESFVLDCFWIRNGILRLGDRKRDREGERKKERGPQFLDHAARGGVPRSERAPATLGAFISFASKGAMGTA